MNVVIIMIVTLVVILLVLALLKIIHDGGPPLSYKELPFWEWSMTKVAPLTCMGFAANAPSLKNQKSPPNDQPLPDKTFTYTDAAGKTQKGTIVPTMGTPAHYAWEKSSTDPSGWTKSTTLTPAAPGTAVDCCKYLMSNGGRRTAIFDHSDASCYLFDYMTPTNDVPDPDPKAPYKAADFANVFPLQDKKDQLKSIDAIDPSEGQYVFMTACGGEGQLPCDYMKYQPGGDPFAAESWPPETRGCSQLGGASTSTPANIKLYRTPVKAPLPFSDDQPWEICQTEAYIRNFGFQPKDIDKCLVDQSCFKHPEEWNFPSELPVWDPTAHTPYDPNTSNARYMRPDQIA